MGILIAIVIGGLAGWLASIALKRDAEQGILLNVIVGVAGAFIANLLIAPLVGTEADITEFSLTSFLLSFAGAAILLAIVNLVTRKKLR